MKALDLFFPHVLPHVHGAGDPPLLHALRQTCIEFCKTTDLVQTITPTSITAAAQDYAITVPTGMVFSRLLGVAWQGRWLPPVSPPDVELDTALTGVTIGTSAVETGSPRAFFQKTPTATGFSIFPIPDATLALGLTVKAAFYPTQAALTVDDVLYDEYAEVIGAGAALRLMGTPGQTYTSPNTKLVAAIYAQGVKAGKRHAMFGKLPVEARARPVAFI